MTSSSSLSFLIKNIASRKETQQESGFDLYFFSCGSCDFQLKRNSKIDYLLFPFSPSTHFNFPSIFFLFAFRARLRFTDFLLRVFGPGSTIEHCRDEKKKLKFVGFFSSCDAFVVALPLGVVYLDMAHGSN